MRNKLKNVTLVVLFFFFVNCLNLGYLSTYVKADEILSSKVLKVTKENTNKDEATNTISFNLNLKNVGKEKIDLEKVKIKYLYTDDGIDSQEYVIDWASISKDKFSSEIIKLDKAMKEANKEFDVSFKSNKLNENDEVNLNIRVYSKNYETMSQINDYSFNNDIVVYYGDQIIQGQYPTDEKPVDNSVAVKLMAYNKFSEDKSTAIYPWIKLQNVGGKELNLKDLKIRYYYSKDEKEEAKQEFICDWSSIGKENVNGTFYDLKSPNGIADSYLEIGFEDKLLSIKKSEEIEVQTRFNKEGWKEYYQKNDLSYVGKATDYIEWNKMEVVYQGETIWGKESKPMDFTKDSDGDGVPDDVESKYGLDPAKSDTDGDGISDKVELTLYPKCDPTKKDTDGNGIDDNKEDFDGDRLTVEEELKLGTDPLKADTDGDGLNDYDEVYVYNTNPLVADTDNDGLVDSDEIDLKTDPNNEDSNENGVLDGQEKYSQQVEQDFTKSALKSVNINFDATGGAKTTTNIKVVSGKDNVANKVVGLVGNPIDITTKAKFDKATVGFKYDKDSLGDTDEKNLDVLWHDKENNTFRLMNSKIDTSNNIVTFETTHFSEYMLVDKVKWFDNWRNKIDYRPDGENSYFDVAFVIDSSGSMSSNDYYGLRIDAVKNFVDSLLDKDEAAVIDFDYTSKLLIGLTSDKEKIKAAVNKIDSSGGTSISAGVKLGLEELRANSKNKQKLMILLTDGYGDYNSSYNDIAKADNVKVYTVALGSETDETLLKNISTSTGGEFYKATTSLDLVKTFEQVRDDSLIDATDTDEDGIPDVVEINGMKTLNGDVIKTDPNNPDTDGDDIPDGEEMGNPITYKVPDEYKEYIDSYSYYPMYSNPLIDDSQYEDDDEQGDNESKGDIADYIPGTAKFFLDKAGIDYSKMANSLQGINSSSLELNFGTKDDYYSIAAGFISGIDDSVLFGVMSYLIPLEEKFGENINYWKTRTAINLVFMVSYADVLATSVDALIAEGAVMAGALVVPGLGEAFDVVVGTISVPVVLTAGISAAGAIHSSYSFIKSGNELVSRLDNTFNKGKKVLDDFDINTAYVKPKHLSTTSGKGRKFLGNTKVEAETILKDTMRNGKVKSIIDNGITTNGNESYKIIIDAGKEIGTQGETLVKIVLSADGGMLSAYPIK